MLLRSRWAAPSGFIEPCLPSPAEQPPSGPGWVHEIKHDGYRLMARRDPIGIRLLTRNGHDWAPRYPLIVEAVNRLKVRSCLIDGEAVACDENGLAVFERLRLKPSGKHVFLYDFDLLELDGQDLRREPRRWALSKKVVGNPGLCFMAEGAWIAICAHHLLLILISADVGRRRDGIAVVILRANVEVVWRGSQIDASIQPARSGQEAIRRRARLRAVMLRRVPSACAAAARRSYVGIRHDGAGFLADGKHLGKRVIDATVD